MVRLTNKFNWDLEQSPSDICCGMVEGLVKPNANSKPDSPLSIIFNNTVVVPAKSMLDALAQVDEYMEGSAYNPMSPTTGFDARTNRRYDV